MANIFGMHVGNGRDNGRDNPGGFFFCIRIARVQVSARAEFHDYKYLVAVFKLCVKKKRKQTI